MVSYLTNTDIVSTPSDMGFKWVPQNPIDVK